MPLGTMIFLKCSLNATIDTIFIAVYFFMGTAFSASKNICNFENSLQCYSIYTIIFLITFVTANLLGFSIIKTSQKSEILRLLIYKTAIYMLPVIALVIYQLVMVD